MIIADSGFWIALLDSSDRHHPEAMSAMLLYSDEALITTVPVLTEVSHLLRKRVNNASAIRFIEMIAKGAAKVFDIGPGQLHRLTALMSRYADLPMDFADASLVLLAEELGHGRILSTDQRDFHTYRWKNHEPFQNLLISK